MPVSPTNIPQTKTIESLTAPQRQDTTGRGGFGLDKVFLVIVLLYLLIPLAATLVFSFNEGRGFTLAPFSRILSDSDFATTFPRSLLLALASTVLVIILVTPTTYWIQLRLPQARPIMDFLSLVPFGVPAIVMAFGLIQVYGSPNALVNVLSLGLVPLLSNQLNWYNTPQLLVCAYAIIALPFVYRPIDNSLRAINTKVLSEAAYSLGSGWWRTFLTVIIPNIWPGIISAALLTFATVMGEFTVAELFSIYTFPIYLDVTTQNDAHKAAALTVLSFTLTLICVLAIIFLLRSRRGAGKADQMDLVAAK
jgi:putative spermidine/putrescine transport system permease protein